MAGAVQNAADIAAKMGAGDYATPIALACVEFGINNDRALAMFLAMLSVESSDFKRVIESMNYSVEGLLATFSRARISREDCMRLGRIPGRAAQQVMIANKVYGGDWGREHLGNLFMGDGWKFRGHGLGQTTGRANIERASLGIFGDRRLIDDPHPLTLPMPAARAAAFFWRDKGCDRMAARNDLIAVRQKWNGGLLGIEHAEIAYSKAKKLLGLP